MLPRVIAEPESSEYGYTIAKAHEAGYDSYMTGIGFIGLVNKLRATNTDIEKKSGPLRQLLNK